jgi:hypothetical protein
MPRRRTDSCQVCNDACRAVDHLVANVSGSKEELSRYVALLHTNCGGGMSDSLNGQAMLDSRYPDSDIGASAWLRSWPPVTGTWSRQHQAACTRLTWSDACHDLGSNSAISYPTCYHRARVHTDRPGWDVPGASPAGHEGQLPSLAFLGTVLCRSTAESLVSTSCCTDREQDAYIVAHTSKRVHVVGKTPLFAMQPFWR